MRRLIWGCVIGLGAAAGGPLRAQDTVRFTPTVGYSTLGVRDPVLRVQPNTVLISKTNFGGYYIVPMLVAVRTLQAQECRHGRITTQVPITFRQTSREPFRLVSQAVDGALKELWYRLDSVDVGTVQTDSGSVRRGYWQTKVFQRWPARFERASMRGATHPGLVATVTALDRGDSVRIEFVVNAVCVTVTSSGDTLSQPVQDLRTQAGLDIVRQIIGEVNRQRRH
jgi:hypothetical protein